MPDQETLTKVANQNVGSAREEATRLNPNRRSESQAPKQWRFLRRHDGFDVGNLVVLLLTFVAASAAAYEAYRLANLTEQLVKDGQDSSKAQSELTSVSLDLNRQALVAGSRAWLGPTDAKVVSGPLEAGKPVTVDVSVRNSGREPARNVRWQPSKYVSAKDDKTLDQKIDTTLRFCFGMPGLPLGQVIYPSAGGEGFEFVLPFEGEEISQEVVDGSSVLVVQGCLAYETFGQTHHSGFCFFFNNKTTKPEHLNICGTGSSAD